MNFTAKQIADRIELNQAMGERLCPALRWAYFDCFYPSWELFLEATTSLGINPKTARIQFLAGVKEQKACAELDAHL
ncbi:hypothetical protein UFOVP1613_39 [uncultured Caudovirales phage]|uniref:Uncharacterized protein n=1 Tax=uncultured Caudovirales phage TaxID=2100421 RepID=A0A6J5R733_9CAUD|nr:hypothetical protein UFOVP1163_41 [uncultured Caudovirales phage]CAB4219309.1 hypothetical protein UFOVP1613_39 [uncultured Caudovirales phage]